MATCDRRAHTVHLWDLKHMTGWQGGIDSPHPADGSAKPPQLASVPATAAGAGPASSPWAPRQRQAVRQLSGAHRSADLTRGSAAPLKGGTVLEPAHRAAVHARPKPLFKLEVGEGGAMAWRPGSDCDLLVADSTMGQHAHLWRVPMRGLPLLTVGDGLHSVAGAAWIRNLRCTVPQELSSQRSTSPTERVLAEGRPRGAFVKPPSSGRGPDGRHAGTPSLSSDGRWWVRSESEAEPSWEGAHPRGPVRECGTAADAWG